MNRNHKPLAVVENDCALVADANLAVDDLEGLMLKIAARPITLYDIDRMWADLCRARLGLQAARKYITTARGDANPEDTP